MWARRAVRARSSPAIPQEVSLPELGGGADMAEIDVEEDGSFAWVAFRQYDAAAVRARSPAGSSA